MSERRRALPSWMVRKEEKVKEKEPLKSRRKRKTARAAFYCMNEKELVEAAVSCLTSRESAALLLGRQAEDEAADATVKVGRDPASARTAARQVSSEEGSSDCGDAQDTTYVSETDLDITEVETVPYAESPQRQGPEGRRPGPDQDHGGPANAGPEAEKKEEHSRMPAEAAEEDDALRLVREIFFT